MSARFIPCAYRGRVYSRWAKKTYKKVYSYLPVDSPPVAAPGTLLSATEKWILNYDIE